MWGLSSRKREDCSRSSAAGAYAFTCSEKTFGKNRKDKIEIYCAWPKMRLLSLKAVRFLESLSQARAQYSYEFLRRRKVSSPILESQSQYRVRHFLRKGEKDENFADGMVLGITYRDYST